MNRLTFTTERVNLQQGDGLGNYLAFYFFIDGQKIESDEYNPADCCDVLDEEAENQKLFVLAHCGCGVWGCSSLVAWVKLLPENVVEWTVDDYRCSRNPRKYYFDKPEYDSTIAEIKQIALKEAKRTKNIWQN
jgi:hypothetical protein